jgi:hypothetical protein
MEKANKRLMFMLIYVISFAIYAVIVFMMNQIYSSVFWVSFAFMVVAFVSQFFISNLLTKRNDIEAIFFGIPLLSISIFYFFAELVVSILMMIFQMIGLPIALAIQGILLGIFVIVAIMATLTRDTVQKIDQNIKEQVLFIRTLTVDVESIAMKCSDPALKKEISDLAEALRYSDPITNPAVAATEQKIIQGISRLDGLCSAGDTQNASNLIKEISILLAERNKKLYMLK